MYLEKLQLVGRIAVITGGGRGIGAACAQALGEAGSTVIIAEKVPEFMEQRVAELKKLGINAHAVKLNVADSKKVDEVAARIVKEHRRVDILVNNAGVIEPDVPAENATDEHWHYHMRVNLDGVFWCCRAFGQQMLKQRKGAIVNIGSVIGQTADKLQVKAAYQTSKAGVHHLTRSLAVEWGSYGVRVNAVAPTAVETPLLALALKEKPELCKMYEKMMPIGRLGQPDEIASVVHFLASDAASLMTGSIVYADGGFLC